VYVQKLYVRHVMQQGSAKLFLQIDVTPRIAVACPFFIGGISHVGYLIRDPNEVIASGNKTMYSEFFQVIAMAYSTVPNS
jgi:hypothetical protein